MKNKFFSLIVFILLLFSFTGCGILNKVFHKQRNNENIEVIMETAQNMYQVTVEYAPKQIDSMCVVDSLPTDFKGWTRNSFVDYETNQYIMRYMYIKELNDNNEMIYIVTPKGEIYIVSKRRVVSE